MRLPAELADTIARWFAVGASHHVYYMWEGGNHLARWAGAAVTNMYADSAPMHSDGLPNEPKRSHMSNLHNTLSSLNGVLLSHPPQLHRAYALPLYDGQKYFTPRVFRSGLTACDAHSALQTWTYDTPQQTLAFHDAASSSTFCLSASSGAGQAVSVETCQPGDTQQTWQLQQVQDDSVTIHLLGSPDSCIGVDLDDSGALRSSQLLLLPCDTSASAVSWKNSSAVNSYIQFAAALLPSSCASAIDAANVTAFTYGSGSSSATFIVNRDNNASAMVLWSGARYAVAAAATIIVDAAGVVLFDTSNVSAVPVKRTYSPHPSHHYRSQ